MTEELESASRLCIECATDRVGRVIRPDDANRPTRASATATGCGRVSHRTRGHHRKVNLRQLTCSSMMVVVASISINRSIGTTSTSGIGVILTAQRCMNTRGSTTRTTDTVGFGTETRNGGRDGREHSGVR